MHLTTILLVGITASVGSCQNEGTVTSGAIFQGRTVGGQDPIITPAPAPNGPLDEPVVAGPLTIGITNMYGNDLAVQFKHLPGYPPALYGADAGPLPGTTQIVYPTGWAGTILVGKAPFNPDGSPANADGSLIEANFVNALPDFDVSYVNGYTVPITCSCDGVPMSGCNFGLYNINSCPDQSYGDTCINPLAGDASLTPGSPANYFFEPCQGSAWTYPNDNDANAECNTNLIECCVGQGCPAPAKQGTHPSPRARL